MRTAIRSWITACFALIVVAGTLAIPAPGRVAKAEAEASSSCCLIAGTNQANNRIEAYDPEVADWNEDGALVWSWKPSEALGYSAKEVGLWGGPSEAKLSGHVVTATAGQLATIAAFPSGTRIWAVDTGSGSNPHSAELLPDGNLAVAASDGKWVRVYTSSQGPNSTTYAQFNLAFAHAVHWDAHNRLLWVIGYDEPIKQHILTALVVGGTAANPTLSEDTSRRSELPTPWGHEVSPYAGDPDKLWISTNLGAYVYDKTDKTFAPAPDGADRTFVKTIGSLPSGQIVETKADNTKTPPGDCMINGWCTDTVEFFSPDATRTVKGAAFYKARIWENPHDKRTPLLSGLATVATFYAGSVPAGGSALPDSFFVRPVQPESSLAIAYLTDPASGRIYLMIVNESPRAETSVDLRFDPARRIDRVTEVSQATGAEIATNYDHETGSLSFSLQPGEGKLYAMPADFRYQIPQQLPAEPPVIGPYTNLALHRAVTASSDVGRSGWSKAAAVDGLRTSASGSLGWTSYNDIKKNHTEWIQIDMGSTYRINTVDLYPRADGANAGLGFPIDFTIQISEDNEHWTTVVNGHQGTKPTGMLAYSFPRADARYVKVEGTNLSTDPFGNYHMQFAEIEVYARTDSPLSLTLSPAKLVVGHSGALSVTGWNADGTIDPLSGARFEYASSDSSVAAVDGQGSVIAHAAGTALISAKVTRSDGTVETGRLEVSVEELPSPWKVDFYGGAYGLITPSSAQDGFSIRANGLGAGPAGDDLVYVNRPVSAGRPISVTTVVESVYKTATGADGQAGIMIRGEANSESAATAPFVFLSVNPEGRTFMMARSASGVVERIEGDYTVLPAKLKLVKTGNRFVGFYKRDGDWVPIDGNPGHSGVSVNMEQSVTAGVAAYSGEAERYHLAVLSGIRIE